MWNVDPVFCRHCSPAWRMSADSITIFTQRSSSVWTDVLSTSVEIVARKKSESRFTAHNTMSWLHDCHFCHVAWNIVLSALSDQVNSKRRSKSEIRLTRANFDLLYSASSITKRLNRNSFTLTLLVYLSVNVFSQVSRCWKTEIKGSHRRTNWFSPKTFYDPCVGL